jgi:hypothetical protein
MPKLPAQAVFFHFLHSEKSISKNATLAKNSGVAGTDQRTETVHGHCLAMTRSVALGRGFVIQEVGLFQNVFLTFQVITSYETRGGRTNTNDVGWECSSRTADTAVAHWI